MIWFNKTYRINFDTDIPGFENAFTDFVTPKKNENGETIPFEIIGELNQKKQSFGFGDYSQAHYLASVYCVGYYKLKDDFLEVKMRYRKTNLTILIYMAVAGYLMYLLPDYMIYAFILIPIYLMQYLIFRIQINLSHQIHFFKLSELITGKIIAQNDDELIY